MQNVLPGDESRSRQKDARHHDWLHATRVDENGHVLVLHHVVQGAPEKTDQEHFTPWGLKQAMLSCVPYELM